MISAQQLQDALPHVYPFRLIDRIVEFEQGKSLTAIKNVTADEWVLNGEAGELTYFPETLMIEAASQAALVLYQLSRMKEGERRPHYILGKVTADFLKTVKTGDQLVIHALANKMLDTGGYSDINLFVGSQKVAQVEIIYSVRRQK